jgi:hypothetical protein
MAYVAWVVHGVCGAFNEPEHSIYISPQAWNSATSMRKEGDKDRYIYMTQPWVASFYTDCSNETAGVFLAFRHKGE